MHPRHRGRTAITSSWAFAMNWELLQLSYIAFSVWPKCSDFFYLLGHAAMALRLKFTNVDTRATAGLLTVTEIRALTIYRGSSSGTNVGFAAIRRMTAEGLEAVLHGDLGERIRIRNRLE